MAKKERQSGIKKAPKVINVEEIAQPAEQQFEGYIRIPSNYAALNQLITRDLNNNVSTPSFTLYSKDDINTYLSDPYRYEKELRKAVVYIYNASPHFRRVINYFAALSDLSYIISPCKIDPKKAKPATMSRNYRKTADVVASMNLKSQGAKILKVCLREDVYYGTMWVTNENIVFQQLPSDYCSISVIEGNVANVTFDFSYFDSRQALLEFYPAEFQSKYRTYQSNRTQRWIVLDSPTSFAIKCNSDIWDYPVPPFAGVLREIYDLEDYRQLKLSKTSLENYAMLVMSLGIDEEGNWQMDLNKAKEFWRNLDSVLPDEVGSVLSPMPINKISFEKSHTANTDTIAEAEQNIFTAAGVSSLLFNNDKASANALLLSIKADQAITFGIVKSIEDMVNRYLHSLSFGKNFKVTFLDVSPYNRDEVGDMYLKAAQYGQPTVAAYAVSQGIPQEELDAMNFLENEILGIKETFIPLQSSATQSSNSTGEAGAPAKKPSELTESGEQTQEDA